MREFFIAFRSRSDAMRFYEEAVSYRLPARIINTPSSAGAGCGLSVKMLVKNMGQARGHRILLHHGERSGATDIVRRFAVFGEKIVPVEPASVKLDCKRGGSVR